MKVFVTKTSDSYWYQIKDIDTIEDLIKISDNKSYVVEENWWHSDDPKIMAEFWVGMSLEDAKIITTLPYNVEIYDDYRE